MIEIVSSRFNARPRPLRNGDMIKLEIEIPFTESVWAQIAPLALKHVKVALCVASQAEVEEAEGLQMQLDGIPTEAVAAVG